MNESTQVKKLLSYRRIFIVLLICFALSGFLFYREFSISGVDWSLINFNNNSILFLLLALIMMVFRDLAYMVRIRLLTDKFLSWRQSLNVILIWEFASAITPGVVGGAAVAMFILQREKIPLGKSTALVIITAILDNFFYILLLPILFLFISISDLLPIAILTENQNAITVFWIGYSVITAINLILFSGVFLYPKVIGKLAILLYKLPILRKRKSRAEKFAEDILIASVELKTKTFLFWVKLFLVTIWSWISRYLVINFLLLAFIELNVYDNFIILARQLVMWMIMLITPTPGGSGMAEYLFSNLLADFIKNGTLALSLAFLWRLISYYPYLIIGSIVLPRWFGKDE